MLNTRKKIFWINRSATTDSLVYSLSFFVSHAHSHKNKKEKKYNRNEKEIRKDKTVIIIIKNSIRLNRDAPLRIAKFLFLLGVLYIRIYICIYTYSIYIYF